MTNNGFGQDEYGQPYNSMGFVTDDKYTDEKKKKHAQQEEKFKKIQERFMNDTIQGVDDDY